MIAICFEFWSKNDPIFEQNVNINFESIFEQNANFGPIFEKSAYFGKNN